MISSDTFIWGMRHTSEILWVMRYSSDTLCEVRGTRMTHLCEVHSDIYWGTLCEMRNTQVKNLCEVLGTQGTYLCEVRGTQVTHLFGEVRGKQIWCSQMTPITELNKQLSPQTHSLTHTARLKLGHKAQVFYLSIYLVPIADRSVFVSREISCHKQKLIV